MNDFIGFLFFFLTEEMNMNSYNTKLLQNVDIFQLFTSLSQPRAELRSPNPKNQYAPD